MVKELSSVARNHTNKGKIRNTGDNMRLLDLVVKFNLRSVAIIGLTKNVGKTVTMNMVLNQAIKSGLRVGVASMGRDGEKEDILTRQEKPKIEVQPGTLVVTAEDALRGSRALLRPLVSTQIFTPLGEVFLYEVRRAGNVELVGPRTQKQLKSVVELLTERTDLAFLDGAINRVLSASPSVSDGTIVATGASLSRSPQNIVQKTAFRLETLRLPPLEERFLIERAEEELEHSRAVLLGKDGHWYSLESPTSFGLGPRLETRLEEGMEKVFLGGALTDEILKAALNPAFIETGKIIISDGTKVFANPMLWKRFRSRGGRVEVMKEIRVVGLTVNPIAPEHYFFDPEELIGHLASEISDIPIMDVVAGIGWWGKEKLCLA